MTSLLVCAVILTVLVLVGLHDERRKSDRLPPALEEAAARMAEARKRTDAVVSRARVAMEKAERKHRAGPGSVQERDDRHGPA